MKQIMKVILATRNSSKARQIRAVFDGSVVKVVTLDQTDIAGSAVEDGNTLEENALKKVRYVRERAKEPTWVMADDSGVFVELLGGEPGVHAAYWGGESLTTEERMRYILKRLEGARDRRATFRTCVVLVSPDGDEHIFYGEATGVVLEVSQGTLQPSMPWSTIFVPDGENRTLAQCSTEEENAISHRGKAFRQARQYLEGVR